MWGQIKHCSGPNTTSLWDDGDNHKTWGKAHGRDTGIPGMKGNLEPEHLQELGQNSPAQPPSLPKAH